MQSTAIPPDCPPTPGSTGMASSSQNHAHSENSCHPTQTPNNRLLWRGSIINPACSRLHGLAIVAHAINPKQSSRARHDPFSTDSRSRTLSDTCLELEMLRGCDLQVDRVSQLTLEPKTRPDNANQGLQRGSRKSRVASLLKGKDPESGDPNRGIPFSEIECDPEVRLYVDPRCSRTHSWILSQLTKRELGPGGFTSDALIVTLDHVVDDQSPQELLIFGRCVEGASSQPSSSNTPAPLQLVIGQRKPPLSQRIPRPDDPMPRAVPAMLFGDPIKSGTDKLGTVPSKSKPQSRPPADQTTLSAPVEPISGSALSPYPSTSNSFLFGLKNSQKRSLKATKKPANTPGRRAKQYIPSSDGDWDDSNPALQNRCLSFEPTGKRKLGSTTCNSTKKMKMITKTLRDGDQLQDGCAPFEEAGTRDDAEDTNKGNSFDAHMSPSPSPASFRCKATTHIPTPGTLNSPFDSMTQPGDSSFAFMDVTNQRATSNPHVKGPKDHPKSRHVAAPRGPTKAEQASKTKSDLSSHLAQNKLLIRKLTSECLNNRGLQKQHPKFKDLYGAVCRGVQFAMREAIEKAAIDKNLTRTFVESHLAMYMILNSDNS